MQIDSVNKFVCHLAVIDGSIILTLSYHSDEDYLAFNGGIEKLEHLYNQICCSFSYIRVPLNLFYFSFLTNSVWVLSIISFLRFC